MAPDNASFYIGKVLAGRFLVDRLIGQGSFAWVFHAYTDTYREVAVKVLHSTEPTARVRFAREIQVLRSLTNNASVVRYLTHGHTPEEWPLVVLEFVDGITLKEGMQRCVRLAPQKAVAFLSELCQAFVGLHQLGVAHRDVKPENILLARQGGIKLIDFGLIRDAQGILKLIEEDDHHEGRLFKDELDRNILVGTPEYMAPEQFADASVENMAQWNTDTWSDVFSLGVILFQLLAGEKAFPMRVVDDSEYAREMYRYVQSRVAMTDDDIPPCPGIDPALQSVIHKAMRRDPRHRQPDARALMVDLHRYSSTGEGIQKQDDSRTFIVNISSILPALGAGISNRARPVERKGPSNVAAPSYSHRELPPISFDDDEATQFSPHRPNLVDEELDEEACPLDAPPRLVNDDELPQQGHTVVFFLDEKGDPAASVVPENAFVRGDGPKKARPSIEPPPPVASVDADPWTQLELERAASQITGKAPRSGLYDVAPEPWSSAGHTGSSARLEIAPPIDAPSPFDPSPSEEPAALEESSFAADPFAEEPTSEDVEEAKHPTMPFPGALPRSASISLARDELSDAPSIVDDGISFYISIEDQDEASALDITLQGSADYVVEEPLTWQDDVAPPASSDQPWSQREQLELEAYTDHPAFDEEDDEPTSNDVRSAEEVTRQVDVRELVPRALFDPEATEETAPSETKRSAPEEVTRRVDIAELVPGEFSRRRRRDDEG